MGRGAKEGFRLTDFDFGAHTRTMGFGTKIPASFAGAWWFSTHSLRKTFARACYEALVKPGLHIMRGRILQLLAGNIFNSDWYFYEVGIGR